jgi:hypothetical protein
MSRRGIVLAVAVLIVAGTAVGVTVARWGSHSPRSQSRVVPSVPVPSAPLPVGAVAPAGLPVGSGVGPAVAVPAGIPSNCSQDATAALDTWMESVPNGAKAVFPADACYQVDGTFTILDKRGVAVDGNGARIEAASIANPFSAAPKLYPGSDAPDQRRDLVIVDSSDVTVSGLTIQGPDRSGRYSVAYGNENGIQVNASTRVLVEDVTVRDTFGDGMVVTGNSTDVTFEHDSVPLAGRNSISDYAGSEVTIAYNTLGACHFIHFDVEPFLVDGQARAAQDVLITHNTLTGHGGFFSDIGAESAVVDDLELSYNTASSVIGMQVGGGKGNIKERANILVVGNHGLGQANDTVRALMNFANVDGLTVSGNVQSFSPSVRTIAVLISNSTDVVVSGNTFPHVTDVLSTGAGMSVKLASAASAGQKTIDATMPPTDLVTYQIGTGGDAEVLTLVTYRTGRPVVVTLGQSLRHNYVAGEPIAVAPSTDYRSFDNTTT